RQRLPVHVLHHQEDLGPVLHHVDHGDHVGVADPRRDPGLVEEHRRDLGIARVLGVQPLEHHRPREPRGPEQPAEVDGRHPSGGDDVEHRVPTDHADGLWPFTIHAYLPVKTGGDDASIGPYALVWSTNLPSYRDLVRRGRTSAEVCDTSWMRYAKGVTQPEKTPFEHLGGAPVVRRIVEHFYEIMARD